jgi:hypothetical protein
LITPEKRLEMERELIATFPSVTISGTVFPIRFIREYKIGKDILLDQTKNEVVVDLLYSGSDQEFTRNNSDYNGRSEISIKMLEDLPATVPGYTTIVDPTTLELEFVVSESNISNLKLMLKNTPGSTSYLRVSLLDKDKKRVFTTLVRPTQIAPTGWTAVPIFVSVRLEAGTSETMYIKLEEYKIGSSPTGIQVAMSGTTLDFAHQVDYFVMADIIGKLAKDIIRFVVLAKNKEKKTTSDVFIGNEDICRYVVKELRKHIWKVWDKYYLNDIRDVVYEKLEINELAVLATGRFDTVIITQDLVTKEEIGAIKGITVNTKAVD